MIVDTYTTPRGVRVELCDDAYAGASETELRRRLEDIQKTAWRCAIAADRRRKEDAWHSFP